jgi:hypothetical protein
MSINDEPVADADQTTDQRTLLSDPVGMWRVAATPLRALESARAVVRMVGRAAAVHAYEVGALASTVAMVPLFVVGGVLEPASSVSPLTKGHAAPTARPVLLVHGFGVRGPAGP